MTTPASPRPPSPTPSPSAPAPDRPSGIFVLGTVFAFLVLVAFGMLTWVLEPGKDIGYRMGELAGIILAPMLVWLVVFGIARAFGKARTNAGKVQVAFWTTAVLALGQCAQVATRVGGHSLFLKAVTDSERGGLVVDSAGIRHALFGFTLPSPGPDFQSDDRLQHAMDSALAKETALAAWVLRSQTSGATVIVEVTKGVRETEKVFRAFTRGVQQSAGKGQGTEVLFDSTTWIGAIREYRYAARSPAGVYVQIRCVPHTTSGTGLIICVTTGSGDEHDLDFVREGLAFTGS